jgi:hypothetical protein
VKCSMNVPPPPVIYRFIFFLLELLKKERSGCVHVNSSSLVVECSEDVAIDLKCYCVMFFV